MHLLRVLKCVVSLASIAYAFSQDQDKHGTNTMNATSSTMSSTPTSTTSTSMQSATPMAAPSGSGTNSSQTIYTGDAFCVDTMCIGALVNGSSVQYVLQSRGAATLGWMAMGFGTQMSNSAMVIMWANADGSITLSQRHAPGHVMPMVDDNPPFIARVEPSLCTANGTNPKFTYTRPFNSTDIESIIWAYATTNPNSILTDAPIFQHIAFGTSQLNLGATLNSTSRDPRNPVSTGFAVTSTNNGTNSTDGSTGETASIPLLGWEKMFIAHGILTAVGFLVLLPFGALIARYARTFTPLWFTGHWVFQFALALPVIVTGVALAIAAVYQSQSPHLADTHMKWGVAIFVLYFAQLIVGALVHWMRPKSAKPGLRRPLQNYFHAIFGLFIIAISFYQVRTGFRVEWPGATGRGKVSNAANIVWYIWVVLMPVLYFAGLLLLRRQFKQEAEGRKGLTSASDEDRLTNTNMRASGDAQEPAHLS